MILVTGAAGKTGKAVIRALTRAGGEVRALVHRLEQQASVLAIGANEAIRGDLGQLVDIKRALDGVDTVYHICPNVNPHEREYAGRLIQASIDVGVKHFGFHSVLHPQTERMPHHWRKLLVEEALFESGLPFTIVQPCAYMQNLLVQRQTIINSGVLRVPYSADALLSMVDLEDVATVVATVLTEPGHVRAIYELSGPEPVSHRQIARVISEVVGRPVRVEQTSVKEWSDEARRNGLDNYKIDALRSMFIYYDRFGFSGNPNVLELLLARPPVTIDAFVQREFED